jgi:tRNA G18 (ribose-2'-O)-methylase SpoU
MTIDAILEARNAVPFKEFVIRTAEGKAFQVPNHDCLLVAEQGKTLIVVTADQKFHILATDLVTSITR